MTRSHKVLGFLIVAVAGVWGCAKSPAENATTSKNPSLEAKAQRLEEDFRTAASARDQYRQKLLAAEERLQAAENRTSQLQSQLDETRTALTAMAGERDAVKLDLKTRTTERDNVAVQFDSFRKNLKNLIGQAESALANPTPPVTVGAQQPAETGAALRN